MGRNIAPVTYNGLKNGWKIARKKYNKEGTKGQSILNFIKKNKKGSKQFRNILNAKKHTSITAEHQKIVTG